MEAMLGISLCSYLYLKLAKILWLSYYLLCFFFNKIREQGGSTDSAWKQGRVAHIMYTHVSKFKNDKRNKEEGKSIGSESDVLNNEISTKWSIQRLQYAIRTPGFQSEGVNCLGEIM
jgi:hypothetical protein